MLLLSNSRLPTIQVAKTVHYDSLANLLYQQFYEHFENLIFVLTSIICFLTKITRKKHIIIIKSYFFSYLCHDNSSNFL